MTDKEKIIAFLEGMSKGCCPNETKEIIINKIIPWINSLPKEPVSEELEEAATEICSEILKGETVIIDGYEYVVLSDAEECFKAGAKWGKNQAKVEIQAQSMALAHGCPKEYHEPVNEELEEAARKECKGLTEPQQIIDCYCQFIRGAQWQKRRIVKEIKSRLVDAATNQDNSADICEQTYYNGMVDALGRLRDKFVED